MASDIIIVFATIALPFIFFILDLSIRAILQMPVDDIGPDVMLIGASLCLARMVEMIDALVRSSQPLTNGKNYGVHFVVFILLFLISLVVWFWCLGILHRKIGENWKFIGGEDLPIALAAVLGVTASLTMTTFYAVSRILI